jgi:hypothetical protein
MMTRCYNKKQLSHKYYGAKGIKVCDRWHDINNFLEDMGEKPTPEHTLDRIDGTKGYSPENCRWVNKYIQMGNTRKSTKYPGVSFYKLRNKFRARIKIDGKEKHLGLFSRIEDAILAREIAYKDICTRKQLL